VEKGRVRVAGAMAKWCWIPLLALAGCGGGGGGTGSGSGSLASYDPTAYGNAPVDETQVDGRDRTTTPGASDVSDKSAGESAPLPGAQTSGSEGGGAPSTGGTENTASTGMGSTGTESTGTGSSGGSAGGPAPTGGAGDAGTDSGNSAATPKSDGDGGAPVVPPGALLALVQGGWKTTSAEASRLYGPGAYLMDGLWNINAERINGRDTIAGIRFRAAYSGSVASIRLYWSDGSGYVGGDGGDIRILLLPDDGSARHLPKWSAAPLATGRRKPGEMSMHNSTYTTPSHRFSPDMMTGGGQVEAGKLYHLVAINDAPDPSQNWSSWDMAFTVRTNGQAARWFDPYDFAVLYGWRAADSLTEPSWQDWTVDGYSAAYMVPIIQINMADGRVFGNSNMETGNIDLASRIWKNGSANPVRERFQPIKTRTISGLSVNTAKAGGSGGLAWQILDGSTVLASGLIDQAAANYQVDTGIIRSGTGVMAWYDIALPSSVRLDANKYYDVQFTPQGSSVWVFADQRNGSAYGFSSPAAFTESQAQHYLNGQWINANHWDKSSGGGGSNWRMVLHQTP